MWFHFDWPNCIGKHSASQHLAHYVKQFVKAYSSDPGVGPQSPYAAFLSFFDAQEDTSTIIPMLDETLHKCLHDLHSLNTIVMISSDGGFPYGSYHKTPAGQADMMKPLLLISKNIVNEDDPHKTIDPINVLWETTDASFWWWRFHCPKRRCINHCSTKNHPRNYKRQENREYMFQSTATSIHLLLLLRHTKASLPEMATVFCER